ncbi:hypothetical protein ABBQ32_010867 [Trebouxia sp. C0010 RCD-2024]
MTYGKYLSVFQVPEAVLARDLLYACQGIDSKYLRYNDTASQHLGGYEVDAQVGVPYVDRQVLLVLSEIGWLFKHIQAHASSCSESGMAGSTIRQSFCSALQAEVAEFYRLMAVLQEQSMREAPKPGSLSSGQSAPGGYLTLRRLVVWLAEPLVRIRGLAGIADATAHLQGGELVNAVYALAQHGDALVQHFVSRVMEQMCQPLFQMVTEWVFNGRLSNAGNEFFVTSNGSTDDLWRTGYRLNEGMRPTFITQQMACTILRAGKSINFLRQCSSEGDWINGKQRSAMLAAAHTPSYRQLASWEHAISAAAAAIDKHLLSTVFTKYSFVKHCDALKRYLLLGQGDFIQTLMDLLGPDLGKKAQEMSEYQLNGSLDAAIRASNAQFDDADVLDRLRVKLAKPTSLETGWDVFILWYDMKEPLSSIITGQAMAGYLRLFRLLWTLKRVEHTLNRVWQVMSGMQRQLTIIRTLSSQYGLPCPGVENVWLELRHCHCLRNEMAHFCTDLQTYIMFEVLETAWDIFMRQLQAATDLDTVIAAHMQYLDTLLKKALLDDSVVDRPGSAAQNGLQGHLHRILRHMLNLMGPVARLNEAVATAAAELKGRADLIKHRQNLSQWGTTDQDKELTGVPQDMLNELHTLLHDSNQEFRRQQQDFVHLLATQAHVDLRYLIFRLDGSDI